MTEVCREHHLFSLLCSLSACKEILDLLPEKDLIDELKYLNSSSLQIIICLIEEKHFGTDNLDWFMEYTLNLKEELEDLRESIKNK